MPQDEKGTGKHPHKSTEEPIATQNQMERENRVNLTELGRVPRAPREAIAEVKSRSLPISRNANTGTRKAIFITTLILPENPRTNSALLDNHAVKAALGGLPAAFAVFAPSCLMTK